MADHSGSGSTVTYVVGDRFWIPDDESAWVYGVLKSNNGSVLEFQTEKGTKKIKLDPKLKLEHCGSHVDDHVENLVDLDELSEGAILHHVRLRFQKQLIYTHVGSILVAVNPFENLDIYGDRDIRRAMEASTSGQSSYPHVFMTAATAYQQLKNNVKNQAVLISGESGGMQEPYIHKCTHSLCFSLYIYINIHMKQISMFMCASILYSW